MTPLRLCTFDPIRHPGARPGRPARLWAHRPGLTRRHRGTARDRRGNGQRARYVRTVFARSPLHTRPTLPPAAPAACVKQDPMKLHFFSVPMHGPAPAALDALFASARVATIDRHFGADGPTHPVHTHIAPQSTNTPACYPPPGRGRWRAAPEGDCASPKRPIHPEPLSLRRPAASSSHPKTTPPKPPIPVLTQWHNAAKGEQRGPCWRAKPRLTHSLGTLHCPGLWVGRRNRGRLVASRSPPPARCATSPFPGEDNHQMSGRFILPRYARGACAPHCFPVSGDGALASTATVDSVPRANHQLTAPGIVWARFIAPNVHSTRWPFVVHIRIRAALNVIAPPFITLRRRAPNGRLSLAKAAWVSGGNPFTHEAVEG